MVIFKIEKHVLDAFGFGIFACFDFNNINTSCDCKDTLFVEALEKGNVLILDGISIVKTCRWLCLVSLEYDDRKDFFLN